MLYTTKERYTSMQTKLQNCGSDGCLFLSLLSIAEEMTGEEIDLFNSILDATKKGYISEDFTVNDSPSLLKMLTGVSWTRKIVTSLDGITIRDQDYTVCKWYNSRTGYYHFRRRGYDTLANSVTVAEGSIVEYYIYTHEV